jgi:O-antigen ligase
VLGVTLLPDLSRTKLAVAAVGGLVLAAVVALVLRRWPYFLAFATLACIPLRLPVDIGDDKVNLLVPLYGVVAGLAVALAWALLRGDDRSRELGPVAWPLAAFVGWSGLSMVWAVDVHRGSILLGAFLLPFGLLAVGFARLPWRGRWLTWLWAGLVGTALLYAAVGGYQWFTRDVFWNPSVKVFNAYAPFFRVNSVFWDPSVYGRYLTVAILASLAGILLGGVRGWRMAGLYAVVIGTWLGLLISFSQSSFVALVAGVLGAIALSWERRSVVALALAVVALLAAGFVVPSVRAEILDNTDRATGNRSSLVTEGLHIAGDHPLGGVGLGGFKSAYGERVGFRAADPARAASHNTPVTVAAELGVPGLLLFGWLVATALWLPFHRASRSFAGRASLCFGLALLAILVHSLFYNAFFEDPMSWGLLGLSALGYAWRSSTRASRARSNGK